MSIPVVAASCKQHKI
nr:hypothetical protein [Mycoplasmopsis bovis]